MNIRYEAQDQKSSTKDSVLNGACDGVNQGDLDTLPQRRVFGRQRVRAVFPKATVGAANGRNEPSPQMFCTLAKVRLRGAGIMKSAKAYADLALAQAIGTVF